jgi:hypothetical protein
MESGKNPNTPVHQVVAYLDFGLLSDITDSYESWVRPDSVTDDAIKHGINNKH